MPHESDYAEHMHVAFVAFRRLFYAFIELDPTWKRTPKFESIWSYDESFFDNIERAIYHLDMQEPISGGCLLRYAFLIAEQKLGAYSLDFLCSICLDVPDLLVTWLISDRRISPTGARPDCNTTSKL
jgi:hypothetical protein